MSGPSTEIDAEMNLGYEMLRRSPRPFALPGFSLRNIVVKESAVSAFWRELVLFYDVGDEKGQWAYSSV